MKSKHIYAIDVTLAVAVLVGLLVLVGYSTPNVIYSPSNGEEIDSTNILFSIKNADYILISQDENFTDKQI